MEDRDIIELFVCRSESAVEELANKHGALCRHIAQGVLSSREDIDECLSDAFLAVWNAVPPQIPDSLAAFAAKVTRNLALKKFQYLSAQKRNPNMTVSLSELEQCLPDKDYQIEDRGQLGAAVNDFLRQQTEQQRNIFIRRYFFLNSVREIASRYGMSVSKVTSMLSRLRQRLKKQLQKEDIPL